MITLTLAPRRIVRELLILHPFQGVLVLAPRPATVQNWLRLLEDLYVIFSIKPWHRNVARAILKAPKYYFYDTAMESVTTTRCPQNHPESGWT